MSNTDQQTRLPKFAVIIIALGILLVLVRLCLWHVIFDATDDRDRKFVESKEAPTGMHCANDRSRWSTVAAIVHHGTFSIDQIDSRRGKHGNWGTIDKVYHADATGIERFYSSKPPLYNVILAAEYWLLHQSTGLHILDQPIVVIKLLTFVNQTVLLLLILIILTRLGQQVIHDRRILAVYTLSITFCTFLTTFAVTLNNHLPAAFFVLLAVMQLRGLSNQAPSARPFILVGLYSAMAVTFELPALAFLCLMGVWCLTVDYKRTLLWGVPGVVIVAAAYFGVNKFAHNSWRPPYAHRSDGEIVEVLSLDDGDLLVRGELPANLDILSESMPGMGNYRIEEHPEEGRWRIFDYGNNIRYALVLRDSTYEVRAWDNWYDYEVNGRKSYWLPNQASGVDLGEPSRLKYFLHLTIGHHGFFSLTPILAFALASVMQQVFHGDEFWRPLSRITLFLTAILLFFYVFRPLQDRNYGGVASGFRWMFWLIPLYALFLAQALNASRKSFFLISLFLVAMVISLYSAHYGFLNPWQNPWPYPN